MTGDDLQRLMDRFEGAWRTEGVIVHGGERDGEMWRGHDVYHIEIRSKDDHTTA